MKRKGFTLIEIIAVIVILGIVMLIAIPAVIQYTQSSNEMVYANGVNSFIQEAKLLYNEKEFGPYIDNDEIMLVPISVLKLEKGSTTKSPYGSYIKEQSYIIIERKNNKMYYYATVVDTNSMGVFEKREDEINDDAIEKVTTADIYSLNSYFSCVSQSYILKTNVLLKFKNTNYAPVDYHTYAEFNKCGTSLPIITFAKR